MYDQKKTQQTRVVYEKNIQSFNVLSCQFGVVSQEFIAF